MLKLTIFLVLIICSFANLMAKDIIPYATIGIRIGYDFKCGLTISPRISVGLTDIDRGVFVNFTAGSRKFQKPIIVYNEFSYFDIQAGAVFKGLPGIFFGGGAGLLIGSTKESFKIIPRSTVFSGCFLFPSIDMTYWKRSKISYDAGLEVVLPIPLGGIDIGSIGGE
jgi:hypothetical protein